MFLDDMNIFVLMTHDYHVNVDILREQDKYNKKPTTCNYEYSKQKSRCGIHSKHKS